MKIELLEIELKKKEKENREHQDRLRQEFATYKETTGVLLEEKEQKITNLTLKIDEIIP